MKNTDKITKQDSELFRKTIGTIDTIEHGRVLHDKPKPSPKPYKNYTDNHPVADATDDCSIEINGIKAGDELYFKRSGIQQQLIRKLRRGQIKVDTELDLHGMTVETARSSLMDFIMECKIQNRRCVIIIHGKGKGSIGQFPVLKNKLNQWLQQQDDVLAFCSAQKSDGGEGAIYVLIKRQ